MRYRTLGRTGVRVSEVGFGAWAIGGGMWGGPRDDDSRATLERARALGVTLYDTALVYGQGHSERLVGEFVRRHRTGPSGDALFVATKVPPETFRWPSHGARVSEAFSPAWIRQCAETSLGNLGTGHIDLLQLHVWEDAWLDDDGWFEAVTRLQEEGKVRFVGVSLNSHEPETGVRLVRSGRVDAVQVIHNVFEQAPEDALLPACLEAGVGVLARVPFDEGSLTGKLREDTTFPPGDFRNDYFGGGKLAETVRRVEALRGPLTDGGRVSMARAALRYVLSHAAVSTVIPGMRSVAQAEEDCAASDDGPLGEETRAALRAHRWNRSG